MEKDHIDLFLEGLDLPGLDPEVEGIVDRINGISRRVKRELEETLDEFELTHGEWQVLSSLRIGDEPWCRSPGELAERLELSSGAMTNRIDRLEEAGYVARHPDPKDRRGIQVELTAKGRKVYEDSVAAQAAKEALIAGALSKAEQQELNALLRKIMLAAEQRDPAAWKKKRG